MKLVIKLLEKELSEFEKSLDKSLKCYSKKLITRKEHTKHISNLKPKIIEFKTAINILKSC